MTKLGAGHRPESLPYMFLPTGACTKALGSEPLIDPLCRAIANAAGRGLLLASGPLSSRKTDWLLGEIASELREAQSLVEALRQANAASVAETTEPNPTRIVRRPRSDNQAVRLKL